MDNPDRMPLENALPMARSFSTEDWFKDFKKEVDECDRSHDDCGVDLSLQEALKDLKVIDCAQRTIVTAPSGCLYMALSYVWGTDQHSTHLRGELP